MMKSGHQLKIILLCKSVYSSIIIVHVVYNAMQYIEFFLISDLAQLSYIHLQY